MKLFGWKSAVRAPARPALTRVANWISGEWPRAYEVQLRELYLGCAIAQRAVRLVAEGVASIPFVANDDAAGQLVSATSGGQALLETLATQLLLHGNGYVQLLTDPAGTPVELFALRPERVSVEADARGWPVAYRYKAGDAATSLPSDGVIHIRTHHPLDDHYGLGSLDAAAGPMAVHRAAMTWNKALLDNAARPSGALVHEAGDQLSAEQFDRLREELATGFAGAKNAGRPMLLEGGLRWQALSLTPADMDFAALKAAAARDIALAFGVPPVLLGLPGDATYANYREANRALWRQSILPLAGKILDAIAEGLSQHFAGLTLRVDADPSRDYQPGVQSIDLHANGQVQHIDLPGALAADNAAHWARERLFTARRETMSAEVRLPWRYLAAWPAASLAVQGQLWRIRSVALDGMCIVASLSPRTAMPLASVPVDGGRIVAEADRAAGRTMLHLADLPSVQDAAASAPLVVAAAAGTTPGWRSAVLLQRAGPTAPWEDLGRTAAPATMGTARNPLGAASPHLIDMCNTLTVEFLHDGMSLLSVADDALWTGANLALVGGEILQFGLAERIAPGRWVLSRLLRGRRGTETRIADHAADAPFLLLDPDTLAALSVPTGANSIDVMAKGVGDADGIIASLSTIGAALRPLSPVHLRLAPLPEGGVAVQWTRRSREGWRWLDGIDVPVAEEAELYRIEIGALPLAESIGATLAQPHYHLSAGQLADMRATGATSLTLSVRQVGRFAPSDPATKAFPL
jgi:HK97 family phage portal protein